MIRYKKAPHLRNWSSYYIYNDEGDCVGVVARDPRPNRFLRGPWRVMSTPEHGLRACLSYPRRKDAAEALCATWESKRKNEAQPC